MNKKSLHVKLVILKSDYLIAGSGLAGINAALHAAMYGTVILVTKSKLDASSSYWAQGGIAAVLQQPDSYESHINDTINAGRGYCNENAVEILVKEGSERVRELVEKGMPFERKGEHLSLGLEGGHSDRRILHAEGASTGKVMVEFLISKIRNEPRITVLQNTFIYDLICTENRCFGVVAYQYERNESIQILSKATILATGGYSALYGRSTNPHTSTGDGLWLAYNHGAVLKDLEFVQFHPTAFYCEKGNGFLISEALRGEGARLYNSKHERFMEKYPARELSPRDVVTKEIVSQIECQHEDFVCLNVTHLDTNKIRQRFPSLIGRIEKNGIDISRQGIPVAPSAHYCIGGIETDINGQTGIDGLYACGEVAATGVHGANRLASNSLLECLVFSKRAVDHARNHKKGSFGNIILTKKLTVSNDLKMPFLEQKKEVTSLLNRNAGIVRHKEGLALALHQINKDLKTAVYHYGNEYYILRMREMLKLVEMIVLAGLTREESRGVHYRADFPGVNPEQEPVRFQLSKDTGQIQIKNKAVSWR
ncbi:MAG: L-aspartate oxidase [Balneolaceae bacterium]|nr:MAG: L-aspartate oxidase [Balneolaceae bacterium]